MSRHLTPVLYTLIDPRADQSQADVIRGAHALGYELVPFNGWSNADLGPSGQPGPRRAEANLNARRIAEIVDALTQDDDCPVIHAVDMRALAAAQD